MESCINVMELLVQEEVKRQIKLIPTRLASYIEAEDLLAFALNQLPPLYATTERGLECQMRRGRTEFKTQITQAVQRARAAILRDPIRSSSHLKTSESSDPHSEVLQQLRRLLNNDRINWTTLPVAVEQALKANFREDSYWVNRYNVRPEMRSGQPHTQRSPRSGHTENGRNDMADWIG